ncbi:hypothetical protein [Actinomadura rubrisoli]|uniref:Uncharacterized protein n=1 Tax=Actinomadura rubrisoli TaxID=2530368 RepID=A0A4V2YV83_9ACTN|nr:hypothetical protein [Actinomadura rubrisoli]TDD80477.1 hypothetical protein E1298_25765 [Actinomadura rubrisoli]
MTRPPTSDDGKRQLARMTASLYRIRAAATRTFKVVQPTTGHDREHAAIAMAAAVASARKAVACAAAGQYATHESMTAVMRAGMAAAWASRAAEQAGNLSDATAANAAKRASAAAVDKVGDADALGVVANTIETVAVVLTRLDEQGSVGTSWRPGRISRSLLGAAVAVLPRTDRDRYGEEWLSLLSDLPTRRSRARHLMSVLLGAPHLSYALRRPLAHRRRA